MDTPSDPVEDPSSKMAGEFDLALQFDIQRYMLTSFQWLT